MMTGTKQTAVRTMKLVIDGYGNEHGNRNVERLISPGRQIISGEYRYYAGGAYFNDRKSTSSIGVTTEDDCWRNLLDEALLNLPAVEIEGNFLSYEDWKLEILCSNEAFISYGLRLLTVHDEEDRLACLLKRFADVLFRRTPPEMIEAYLATDKHVRQVCF